MAGLGRKRSGSEKKPKGEGPDTAEIHSGWVRRGKHIPLEGGTGLFEYKDSKGETQRTHRFKLFGKDSD